MRSSAFLLLFVAGCSLVLDTSPPDPTGSGIVGKDAGPSDGMHCTGDAQCDDGNPCNGVETCDSDFCRGGTAVVCDGGGEGCHADVCNPESGACEPQSGEVACDDAIDCTVDGCNDAGACEHRIDHEVCDDGVACTQDVCLGAAIGSIRSGCYSVPQDSLCPQPAGTAGCAAYVCAPRAAASDDATGCAIAPRPFACETGMRCNLGTLVCEPLPNGCDGCDDGDPCNGIEACEGPVGQQLCASTPTCGAPTENDACHAIVCNRRDADANACLTVTRGLASCLAPGGP